MFAAEETDAISEQDECAQARDPVRCEARQAALASCADSHGVYKRACLEAALPAVDCSKSKKPETCDRAQRAKSKVMEACKGKVDEELVQCLKQHQPKKATKKAVKEQKAAKQKAKGKAKAEITAGAGVKPKKSGTTKKKKHETS
jgi:hypothetical protein